MKNNEMISIIVPVYNVEKYIENTINSLLAQSYPNVEIILVDDGSTDFSGKICDRYSNEHNNIKTFHKKNGGLADARNYGLNNANGIYVCFVDGDDYIHENMIEYLYDSLQRNSAQVSVCNFKKVYEKFDNIDTNIDTNIDISKEIVLDNIDALKAMVNLNCGFAPNVCNKMFKKNLFTKDCYFPAGKLYEDMIVTTKILAKVEKVSYINCEMYYYLQRSNSITGKFNEKEKDHIEMSNEVLRFVQSNLKEVHSYFITYHAINCISVINKMIQAKSNNDEIYSETQKFIKNNERIIFNDSNLSIKKKIQLYIFMISKNIYTFIYKIGA